MRAEKLADLPKPTTRQRASRRPGALPAEALARPRVLRVDAAGKVDSTGHTSNDVCTVSTMGHKVWGSRPVLQTAQVFVGSVVVYFCNPDDFFFLFIA